MRECERDPRIAEKITGFPLDLENLENEGTPGKPGKMRVHPENLEKLWNFVISEKWEP